VSALAGFYIPALNLSAEEYKSRECSPRAQALELMDSEFSDNPTPTPGTDFRSQHPFAAAAIGVTLIGVGSITVIPAVTAGILGAVGFTSGGVAAGRNHNP